MKTQISKNKSLLDSEKQILIHQVNCQAVMGSGIAKAIRDKWPVVYEEYVKFCRNHNTRQECLGQIHIVKISNKQAVCNLFGQFGFSRTHRDTDYDAVVDAFEHLKVFCVEKGVKSIALPVNMGCGLGGGNWNIYKTIVLEAFKDTEVEIEFCEYNG